jgi:hypothetical protein
MSIAPVTSEKELLDSISVPDGRRNHSRWQVATINSNQNTFLVGSDLVIGLNTLVDGLLCAFGFGRFASMLS